MTAVTSSSAPRNFEEPCYHKKPGCYSTITTCDDSWYDGKVPRFIKQPDHVSGLNHGKVTGIRIPAPLDIHHPVMVV